MYRIPELSSSFFTAFAWCDFILSIMRTELPFQFSLLGHIGDAPVYWHEEISSYGDILLSEENARLYQC